MDFKTEKNTVGDKIKIRLPVCAVRIHYYYAASLF